jgi:spoIIIJ-associated protein
VREVKVHAANREEALSDGAAALGVAPRLARVEILVADEDGVTALVFVPDEQSEPPAPPAAESADGASAADSQSAADGRSAADSQSAATAVPEAEGAEAEDGDETARRHLQVMLDLMAIEAQACVAGGNEDELLLNIEGEDLGVVIGNCGQTLNSVQFLLNLMTSRGGRRRRITVDAEGYRDRRRQRLEELAIEHARRAKSERRPVILEGLRAAERRIIHTTLQHDPDVVSYSEGEEPHRRLIITPRD